MLTGHGCFGEYLHRIGRERSNACHHCDAPVDTVSQHMLTVCPAWEEQRRVLRRVIGEEVSLSAIVRAMADGEDKWKAATSFCGEVMSRKEAAERERGKRKCSSLTEREGARGGVHMMRVFSNSPM